MEERTIILVDMNAFFASVEQQSNPMLRGKPVLVGGSVAKRSVVAAASYESRPYGIHSGMATFEAIAKCPDAILISGDPTKYSDTSRRVFDICGEYTDMMEIYSIDECFLDVTCTQHMFGGAWEIARSIKRRIRIELGLTCSIGIAPNIMLCKIAANMQKPDGLVEIEWEEVKALLENLPVGKLHGVGNKLTAQLEKMGIKTAGQLGRTPKNVLKLSFGVYGEALHDMGNGTYNPALIPYHSRPDIKSVSHAYTLSRNTRNIDLVQRHLLRLSEMVGRRLREQEFAGKTITLVIRYSDMHTYTYRKTFPLYYDDGFEIYQAAMSILRQHSSDKRAIRLVGVCVSGLAKNAHQMNLFTDPHARKLLSAIDAINDRYGEFAVKRASLVGIKAFEKTHGFGRREPTPH